MLKYFKKGRRGSESSNPSQDGTVDAKSAKRNSLRSSSSYCDEIFWEEHGLPGTRDAETDHLAADEISLGAAHEDECDSFEYSSRLSMSLGSIVSDPNCLGYFLQFLDEKNALPLIRFFMDTKNFRQAALSQLQKEYRHRMQQQDEALATTSLNIKQQAACFNESTVSASDANVKTCHESDNASDELQNNVPELKTLCDLSMRKPLTDDEKCEIYAETTKQIEFNKAHKLKCCSSMSLCSVDSSVNGSEFHTDIRHASVSAASVKDAVAIYQKYLSSCSGMQIKLPLSIISQISLLLCQNTATAASEHDETAHAQTVSADCFEEAQQYVLHQLETEYISDFLQSHFYCKYCLELVDEGKLNIFDILFSEVTLFYFMEFLEQHGERNCLDFWSVCVNFRKSFKNFQQVKEDAMIIYERFFSLQAEGRLWLSDKLRCYVEQRICSSEDEMQSIIHCFDVPLQIMAKYLDRKYFQGFLKSQLFETYHNELRTKLHEELNIGTVDSGATSKHNNTSIKSMLKRTQSLHSTGAGSMRHRKTRSDCSNEGINTLLATQSCLHKNPTAVDSNYACSSNNLTLLTHRHSLIESTSNGVLKFGHINALGRYERDFDTQDIYGGSGVFSSPGSSAKQHYSWSSLTSGGNKFKNAMRRLINMPEDKAQEEIAWQVAEMIVNDVTSVTLAASK